MMPPTSPDHRAELGQTSLRYVKACCADRYQYAPQIHSSSDEQASFSNRQSVLERTPRNDGSWPKVAIRRHRKSDRLCDGHEELGSTPSGHCVGCRIGVLRPQIQPVRLGIIFVVAGIFRACGRRQVQASPPCQTT